MKPTIRAIDDILDNPMPKPPPLVYGLLNQSEVTIISGPEDALKSRMSLALACAVASGEPFLGKYRVARQAPALVWQQEIHGGFYDARVVALDLSGIPLYFCYTPFGFSGDYEETLATLISDMNLGLIVYDPLTHFYPASTESAPFDENSAASLHAVLAPLWNLRSTGVTQILVHHDAKAVRGESNPARGSSILRNDPDTRMWLTPQTGVTKQRTRVEVKTRNQPRPEKFTIELQEDGSLTIAGSGGRPVLPVEISPEEMAIPVRQLAAEKGVGKSTIARRKLSSGQS